MRFEILAFAAIAATASADAATDAANATTCGNWKYQVYADNSSGGGGWTLDTVDNVPIYKDSNGDAVTDWTSWSGYDTSKCAEVAAAAAAAAAGNEVEEDGAAYLATSAALAAFAATLAL